jgi:hypothetical protein
VERRNILASGASHWKRASSFEAPDGRHRLWRFASPLKAALAAQPCSEVISTKQARYVAPPGLGPIFCHFPVACATG